MNFFKKMFSNQNEAKFVEDFLEDLFQLCSFSLSCDKAEHTTEDSLSINIYGPDEELLFQRKGQLLQAIQVYTSAVLQHRVKKDDPDKKVFVSIDSGGFLKENEQHILNLAEKLKKEALRKNRSVIIKKPLNSFQRRQIHQRLTEDGKVKTHSIGEGFFKIIKIIPQKDDQLHEA